jgi:hypothetical protein
MRIVALDGYTLNPGDLSWDPISELGEFVTHDRTPADQIVERTRGAAVTLTNKEAFHRQCAGCHDQAAKARQAAAPTAQKCMACHKK